MVSSLPFVIRVAAGLVSETVDVLRRLPAELPALPITLAGNAAKVSMRVSQHLADLAIRGDAALDGLPGTLGKGADVPAERTSWSRIDDDDAEPDMPAVDTTPVSHSAPNAHPSPAVDAAPADTSAPAAPKKAPAPRPSATSRPSAPSPTPTDHAAAAPSDSMSPTLALADFDTLSSARIRAALPGLTAAQIGDLLTHERSHARRAAVLTLLDNRLTSLDAGVEHG